MRLDGARVLFQRLLTYDLKADVQLPGKIVCRICYQLFPIKFFSSYTDDINERIMEYSWVDLQENARKYFEHNHLEITSYFG